eukprot:m.34039 g.34039  ORF g.34039 m.34039 type:complete len:85 (+) comp5169_c0_seq1:3494-3748(+)
MRPASLYPTGALCLLVVTYDALLFILSLLFSSLFSYSPFSVHFLVGEARGPAPVRLAPPICSVCLCVYIYSRAFCLTPVLPDGD